MDKKKKSRIDIQASDLQGEDTDLSLEALGAIFDIEPAHRDLSNTSGPLFRWQEDPGPQNSPDPDLAESPRQGSQNRTGMQKKTTKKNQKINISRKSRKAGRSKQPSRLSGLLRMRPGSDPVITVCILGLLAAGTIMVVSVAQAENLGDPAGLVRAVFKQASFVALSLFAYWFMDRFFSYDEFTTYQPLVYLFMVVVMFGTAFAGTEISGARAWLTIGPVSIQPSEFCKPFLIAMYAWRCWKVSRSAKLQSRGFLEIFKPELVFSLLIMLALAFQKDFGTMIILVMISVCCWMIPGFPSLQKMQRAVIFGFVIIVPLMLVLFVFTDVGTNLLARIPQMAHIVTRIENMKDPYQYIYEDGYQPANALYAMADAGIFGKGLGNSVRKYGFLTQAESDYILAVVIEETGLIGLSLIVGLYGLLVYRLAWHAQKISQVSAKVMLGGTISYLLLHFVINVGGVTGLIPMTGVPLLFISSGGSSILSISTALGMCQAQIALAQKRRPGRKKGKVVHL